MSSRRNLEIESGLILLAIAVSGAPFIGLLGTVWGVMSTFAGIAQQGQATMAAMAPGVAAALVTTVAGLLVAIPSMFSYNWLVHNLRVFTVAWTISRRNWSQKWKRNILKRTDHATIFTTRSSGDVERVQHHAVARPRVRAAHHLHYHDAAAGTKHQPQAATGGRAGWKIDPRNIRTVEISNTGIYALDKQRMNLNQIISKIATDYRGNPNLIVYIRAEKTSPYENVAP